VISDAARRCGYDERHWTTEDGHLHTSVPAEVPVAWRAHYLASGLVYISGDAVYAIRRRSYGMKYSYAVLREGVELPLGGTYSRLKDAKERAVENAEGRDRVHVA
jgi:hypothetical protein